jgi:hypothetical protein
MTISNGTAGQNYTFAATSPVIASGKLMYLGYHGISTGNIDDSSTGKASTSTKSDNNHSNGSSNDKKSSSTKSSDHSSHGSTSSSSSSSTNRNQIIYTPW